MRQQPRVPGVLLDGRRITEYRRNVHRRRGLAAGCRRRPSPSDAPHEPGQHRVGHVRLGRLCHGGCGGLHVPAAVQVARPPPQFVVPPRYRAARIFASTAVDWVQLRWGQLRRHQLRNWLAEICADRAQGRQGARHHSLQGARHQGRQGARHHVPAVLHQLGFILLNESRHGSLSHVPLRRTALQVVSLACFQIIFCTFVQYQRSRSSLLRKKS